MKPTTLKHGTKIIIQEALSKKKMIAFFIRRQPAAGGSKAINILRVPEFEGLMSPDDPGITEMSDYDLSRRGEYV